MIGRYKLGDSLPGYGDPETWPTYSGHPNDPRGEDEGCPECGAEIRFTGAFARCTDDDCGWEEDDDAAF